MGNPEKRFGKGLPSFFGEHEKFQRNSVPNKFPKNLGLSNFRKAKIWVFRRNLKDFLQGGKFNKTKTI